MRITEQDARAHRDQAVDEEQPALEELLVDQHGTFALGGEYQRQRREVGRKTGPRGVVDLRDAAVDVGHDHPLLRCGHEKTRSLDVGLDTEPREHQPDHAQVVGRRLAHAQGTAGHRGDRDEGADLDVIRADPVSGRPKLADAVDLEDVAADPSNARPHRVQGMTEPLDVGLGGRVQQASAPVGGGGRHDRGFRPGHAGLVQEDLGAPEPARELQAVVRVVHGDPGAELAKGEEMRVQAPPPDLVAARTG